EKPVRFQISADDMLKAEMEAMRRDLDIIGVFHSHPDHPPVASPRDLAWATWPGYSYIITQVWEGEATYSQSWQLLADRSGFVEEKIVETGD
ncbi:MAG: M67 family metallopeptidase, partial [Candidatus Promineifilaceae bacterium]